MIKAPDDLVCGESSLPGLQTDVFSLCLHMAFLWCAHVHMRTHTHTHTHTQQAPRCLFL